MSHPSVTTSTLISISIIYFVFLCVHHVTVNMLFVKFMYTNIFLYLPFLIFNPLHIPEYSIFVKLFPFLYNHWAFWLKSSCRMPLSRFPSTAIFSSSDVSAKMWSCDSHGGEGEDVQNRVIRHRSFFHSIVDHRDHAQHVENSINFSISGTLSSVPRGVWFSTDALTLPRNGRYLSFYRRQRRLSLLLPAVCGTVPLCTDVF